MDVLQQAAEKRLIIYGAHLVALELYRYLKEHLSVFCFEGFAVTAKEGNPDTLEGEPVKCILEYEPSEETAIFLAMPQKYHAEVKDYLKQLGFCTPYPISQEQMELLKSEWMLAELSADFIYEVSESPYDKSWLDIREKEPGKRYFKFPTLFYKNLDVLKSSLEGCDLFAEFKDCYGEYRNLQDRKMDGRHIDGMLFIEEIEKKLRIYMAFSQWDSGKNGNHGGEPWVVPIQAGSILTENKSDCQLDETGENISGENRNLAEMTAAYWIWKNERTAMYKGLCHYRRHFVLDEDMAASLFKNGIDVVLTVPRYVPGGVGNMFLAETPVKQFVYDSMVESVKALYPEETGSFLEFLGKSFYCPNNMVIARTPIYDKYCEWVFSVLFHMQELDQIHRYGHEKDRHLAYAAELLTSFYFLSRYDRFRIAVTDYKFMKE